MDNGFGPKAAILCIIIQFVKGRGTPVGRVLLLTCFDPAEKELPGLCRNMGMKI